MVSTEKKKNKKWHYNLEADSSVLFSGLLKDNKPGRQDSQVTLKECSQANSDLKQKPCRGNLHFSSCVFEM